MVVLAAWLTVAAASRRARVTLAVAVLTIAGAAVPHAQAATIGDLIAAAEHAAVRAGLNPRTPDESTHPDVSRALGLALETLRSARVHEEEIGAFMQRYVLPDALARARRRQHRYTPEIGHAINTIKDVANVFLPSIKMADPVLDALIIQVDKTQHAAGLEWDLETLRRLERKYGPDSARLNGVEVLLAYSLQRVPGFGVETTGIAKGRPGPLEAVAAYAPIYLTRSDDEMRVVGVFEGGLRWYFFGQKWGSSAGRLQVLRPAYASFGLAVTNGSLQALRTPWKGDSRYGLFVGWGQLKAAWLPGENQQLLVTQQFQMIPWVF